MLVEELQALAAVLEQGSFLKAAEALGVPRATLRRRVQSLERRLDTPVLVRGSRGVVATAAGAVLRDGSAAPLRELDTLLSSASATKHPRSVRVALPLGMPQEALTASMLAFRAEFPDLQVRLRFYDDPKRNPLEEADLALHVGHFPLEGPWATYHLATIEEGLVASPAYLARRGTPESLADLHSHGLLTLHMAGEDPNGVALLKGGTFEVQPVLAATDPRLLETAALAGLGIALCPIPPPQFGRRAGLERVLPDIVGSRRPLRLIVPQVLVELPELRAIFRFACRLLGRDLVESS